MEIVVILGCLGLVLGLAILAKRLFRTKSKLERFLELDTSEMDMAAAALLKKEPLGYVVRSGGEDENDPVGFRLTLRLEAPTPVDIECVQLIRPSDADEWELGSIHLVSYSQSDPNLWVFSSQLTAGGSGAHESAPVEATTLHFAAPLSLGSMNSPHPWLLPAKNMLKVVVIDLNDAHEGDAGRDAQLTNLAMFLGEEIAFRTNAHASSVLWLSTDQGKLVETSSTDAVYEAMVEEWIQLEDHDDYIVVHGTATGPNDLSIRFTIRHRQQVKTFECDAFSSTDFVLKELAAFGVADAPTPQWYQKVSAAQVRLYQAQLGMLAILTVQNIGMLPSGDWRDEIQSAMEMAEQGDRWRALALALARAHLKANPDDQEVQAFIERTLSIAPFSHLWPCFGRSTGEELAGAQWTAWRERVDSDSTLPH